MSDRMYFETAPVTELCECVGVDLTAKQAALIDAKPEWAKDIVHAALKKGEQQRSCDAQCSKCQGYGVH